MDKFLSRVILILTLFLIINIETYSQNEYQPILHINKLLKIDTIACKTINIGKIQITSGKVVACDPLSKPDCLPFYYNFPKGIYPVEIVIADLEYDQRIIMASILFSNDSIDNWKYLGYTNPKESSENLGYFVESGVGSFMDLDVCNKIDTHYQYNEKFYDYLMNEMRKNYKHTREWCVISVDKQNIAIFSAGYGDGMYRSYIGFNKDGNMCRLSTSFLE